jgi:predicted deacylase
MLLRNLAAAAVLAISACAQTSFTGDVISGYPVITSLDLNDVPSNAVTRYWLYAATGQGRLPYYLPVFVARGSDDSLNSGRKLSLSNSIHGDELNGIPVVQRVFASLTEWVASGDFNGTVIGLPTANPNGNLHNHANFFSSSDNGFLTNLNRIFPGESLSDGGRITDNYVYNIWNGLWGNLTNVDIAVDMHTLSTGSDAPFWAYADFSQEGVQRLAELAMLDIIKIDSGAEGTIETTFVASGVPAITLEIGTSKVWRDDYIDRAEQYIYRLLNDLYMLPDSAPPEIDLSNTYKANNISSASASYSGWVNTTVELLEDVQEGQELAVLYDSWGDVLETLTASVSGKVLTVRLDPAIEEGARVVWIAYNESSAST